MPNFFAICPKGLSEVLEKEIHDLGITSTQKISAGVFFDCPWEGCYKVNLHSRVASRVVKPVLDFPAYNGDDIYNNIMKHDFTKYIDADQTMKVDAALKDCAINDQRFLAMKVKDAVVDQYRDKYGVRPDVDNGKPALRVMIQGSKNQFHVSVDTSGDALFMRGYRMEAGEAPMKENLAAALMMLSEWDRQSPVIDPLCGSGTILIEAAMMAMNIAPGSLRNRFGFMSLKGYDAAKWDAVVEEAISMEKPELPFLFYGADIDRKVLRMAKDNARRAGVDHVISFKQGPISTYEPEVPQGLVVTNPPYGMRIGDEDNVRDVYRDLSYTLKNRFKGWNAWILSGNKDLITDLKLKSTRRHFTYNGPIECRFLKYEMF
jgi:23S rRNA (guanine2445-N2)-methyltransferase / 23S rRNA (guanine2069-N7)-methyltransferase